MDTLRAAVVACFGAMSLAACDSFRGAQQPIEPPATTVAAATQPKYSADSAISAFYSSNPTDRDGLSPRDFRDKVVSLRLMAIEARYQAFVQELRSARAGVGLGADIATLVLGGLGTIIADTTAKTVLAAGTATVAGSRVSFDKNLFYDQTLPAIVAQMDAERAKQMLIIRTGLTNPPSSYSLPDAFMDLAQLERLGSIEMAIQKITGSATTDAAKANADLRAFQRTKDFVGVDMTKLRSTLLDKVGKFDDGTAIMKASQIAGGSQVFTTGDAARQYLQLKIRFEAGDLAALQKISNALQ